MNIIKHLLLFIFVFSFTVSSFSQAITILDKADEEFNSKNYYKASSLYKRAIRRSPEDQIKRIYFQLGECYRQVNNYGQARQWYAKAIEAGYDDPAIFFHVGNLLAIGGDYRAAKGYFERFLQAVPDNKLAQTKVASCDFAISLETDRPFYEVKNAKELNTEFSDYSLTFINKNKVVISSMRIETTVGSRIDPRTMQGFSNLFESDFDAQRERWSKPSTIKGEINTNYNEGSFAYNEATKTGYFMQCRGKGAMDNCLILTSQYNENSNQWSRPRTLDLPHGNANVGHPALSKDGKTLIFVSDMPGGYGGTDLWMSKYDGFTWGRPINLGPTINTPGNEMFPYFFEDKVLYFSSDGHIGLGGLDIFSSEFRNEKFSKPENLKPPFNSSADDFGFSFKDKSKYDGFFASNRPGGLGDDDIYYFSLIPVVITLSGSAVDNENQKALRDVKIYLQGEDGSLDSTMTDRNGNYKFTSLKANTAYRLYAQKDGYLGDSKYKVVGDEKYSIDLTLDESFSLIKITKEEIEIKNIYYDYAKWSLREESKDELIKLVNILKENPVIKIMINSHTDVRGSATYNQELSEKRAQSVVEYLTSKGIEGARLQFKGWGAERLLIRNAVTEEEHQLNRRTTFNILNIEEISSKFVVKTFEPLEVPRDLAIKETKKVVSAGFDDDIITPDSINNAINSFFEGDGIYTIDDILEMINKLFE